MSAPPYPTGQPGADVVVTPARPAHLREKARSPRVFRPDIQALRAVAVMSVVLYHLWPLQVRGGYVGVDIFFVISGFLITQHLADEITRTGRVSLTHFWARRIRRLLPAAFLVLGVSLVGLLTLMPRVTWKNNLQEIAASASYVENWTLGFHAVDYLAAHNSASLVQHYWSLAVEEQFYLFWPLMLLLALAMNRRIGGGTSRRPLRWVIAAVSLASFAFSVAFTAVSPAMSFFATPTRAWEFGVGAMVALSPTLTLGAREAAIRAAAGWAGLALIAYSVFLITGDAAFPGWIAAVPVAGGALVLAAGPSSARWSSAPLARLPLVQWLGNYSYSLYLWHWPLIIIAPWLLHGPTTVVSKLVILVVSLVLAYVTKLLVEDPIRTGVRWRRGRWPSYLFAATGMVVFLVVAFLTNAQLTRSNEAQAQTALAQIVDQAPCYGAEAIVGAGECTRPFARPAGLNTAFAAGDTDSRVDACQQSTRQTALILCSYGQTENPTRTVVVVGNSHAGRLVPALDIYGRKLGWKIVLVAKTDCMGLISTPIGDQTSSDTCLTWSGEVRTMLLTTQGIDAVIFASHVDAQVYLAGQHASPATVETARTKVLSTWKELDDHGIPVIVTGDVPGTRPAAAPECIAKTDVQYDPCAQPRSKVVVPNLMTTLAKQNPDVVTYLPLDKYFCDATTCHALIGGVVVYSDSHHVTTTYAQSMGKFLGADVSAIIRKHQR